MKILVLSYYYHPDLSAGSFRVKSIIDSLINESSRKINIDIVTTKPNRYQKFRPEINDNILETINIHRIKVNNHKSGLLSQSLAFIIFAFNTLKFVKNKDYDLIFASSSRLMTAALGAYISMKKNINLYLDIRDIFLDTIEDVYKSKIYKIIKLFIGYIEKLTINQASHINLVSEGFANYFNKKYPNKSYSFFTNGIDSIFASLPIKKSINKKIKILYAGNIGEGQGLDKILPKLLLELPNNYYTTIIGDGGRRKKLELELEKHKAINYEILNPVTQEALILKYLEADILFLHLNSHNAFLKVLPSKIFEFAATHKPICAGVSGYSREFLLNNVSNCSIFEPCNVKDAKKCILNIDLTVKKRTEFINKFSRNNISIKIAKNILGMKY